MHNDIYMWKANLTNEMKASQHFRSHSNQFDNFSFFSAATFFFLFLTRFGFSIKMEENQNPPDLGSPQNGGGEPVLSELENLSL